MKTKTLKQGFHLMVMISSFMLMSACADSERETETTVAIPQPNIEAGQQLFGGDFNFRPTAVGEYIGIGTERAEQGFGTAAGTIPGAFGSPINHSALDHQWFTLIEFLTPNGEKVNNSFREKPTAQWEKIRMTLESDIPGKRVVVTGDLFFRFPTGSIMGGQVLIGNHGADRIEIRFPQGVHLQLLDVSDDRRIVNGVIHLTIRDALTGAVKEQHKIDYFGG